MPIITVFPDVIRAYNRVEVDWADVPSVDYAKVTRVDVVTGQCTVLRPYICFSGDYLNVSCDGHGVFWDTEVPLDRSVYYITEGLDAPCEANATLFFDLFDRITVNAWGISTSGGVWSLNGGAAPDYQVDGNFGTMATAAAGDVRRANTNIGTGHVTVTGTYYPQEIATGAAYHARLGGRGDSTGNFNGYEAYLTFNTSQVLQLSIAKIVAGTLSIIAGPVTINGVYAVNAEIHTSLSVSGDRILAKAWNVTSGETEPDWLLSVADSSVLDDGNNNYIAAKVDTAVGNTNGSLLHIWDNIMVVDPCPPCVPISADTSDTPTTMPSNGAFRLKDPVRPCNDLYVPLCFDQVPDPSCLPGSGIFFAQVDTESYDANTIILNPTNASLPIAVNRARRAKASVLQLVTRTFDDRDALLRINAPGSPLLLQGPPNYGIPDAYISVGTVSVDRGLTDHRFPVRINNLPFLTVSRPAGPSQGVCGSQVQDSCDIYDTWAELETAGLTFEDLVRGRASNDATIGPAIRTWDEVQASFADWNAVEANGTWADLESGA